MSATFRLALRYGGILVSGFMTCALAASQLEVSVASKLTQTWLWVTKRSAAEATPREVSNLLCLFGKCVLLAYTNGNNPPEPRPEILLAFELPVAADIVVVESDSSPKAQSQKDTICFIRTDCIRRIPKPGRLMIQHSRRRLQPALNPLFQMVYSQTPGRKIMFHHL